MQEAPSPLRFAPRTQTERARRTSLVDVELDVVQRSAVALPEGRSLLLRGEAGHGKTTVLLHRVARLVRARPELRAVVLAPTDGLVALLGRSLVKLGVDVDVVTFDAFAAKQARRAFRRLPRESDLTPPAVSRLKRADAVHHALVTLAAREEGRIDEDADAAEGVRARRGANVSRGDLQHLFGDRVLVERVAREAGLGSHAVEETLERTRVQFTRATEDEMRHVVDRERLVAIDGRALDDGTSTGHAATIDVEDYPVLFELDRLRAARRGGTARRPRVYDVVAIDEAQELSGLELALVGRALAPGGSLVVSGDAEQHTDDARSFGGWATAMHVLGADAHEEVTLGLGYRCARRVADLARSVRNGARAVAPAIHAFATARALADAIGPMLSELLDDDPGASVGVLCRRPHAARALLPVLRDHVPARLVFDGRFLARGPVQVTTVSEVKGLEVDFVIVADASAAEWPMDAAARRAMYVAVTRARHDVAFACVGAPTEIFGEPRQP